MKVQLALVYGGASVEHEVSILTALQCAHYIDREQFDVIFVYYDKHQHFYIGEVLQELAFYQNMDYTQLQEVTFEYKNFMTYLKPKALFRRRKQIDIALPLVHGTSGEDGTLQGLFETMQLPYCQSSLASCAIGMDKDLTKQLLRSHQLPVLEDQIYYRDDVVSNLDLLEACEIPFPWIIKPAHGGSSIGIQCAQVNDNISRKALECFAFDHKVLIEHQLSDFREFNLAILGDRDNQICSQIEEVYKSEDILSYQDKYLNHAAKTTPSARHQIPSDISDELKAQIEELGIQAFLALDCSGMVRVDFLYYKDTLIINEMNLIPGSLSLYLFDTLMNKTEILNTVILLGFKKHRQKMREIRQMESPLLKQKTFNDILKN